ncbi:MAG: class I SAM-dependent DNA methyltransferase, partial [Candidatus Dadabacteria bacterium]
DEYLNKTRPSEKQKVKYEIEDLIIKLFEAKLERERSNYFQKIKDIEEKSRALPNIEQREEFIRSKKRKLYKETGFDIEQFEEQLREYTTGNKTRPFFPWKLYFAEVFQEKGGFDVVIGNPPYVQLQKAGGALAKLYKDLRYETFDRRGDIYTLFYEKGLGILKTGGHLIYITSNKWMRAGYGEKLRSFLAKHNSKVLIDLGPGVFETATVDTNIIIVQKQKNQNALLGLTYTDKTQPLDKAVKENSFVIKDLSSKAWFIGSEEEQKLKEKIERIGRPLKEWDVNIYRGILTGLNEAFIITTEKRNEILANCKDKEERQRTEAIIKPILRGRDIKRYYYKWAGLWVV